MPDCTLMKKIHIVEACFEDYKNMAVYHYRDSNLGPWTNIFALKPKQNSFLDAKTVGVIVYSMPNPSLELRNAATNNFFIGLDRSTQLSLLNKTIRRISRLIIEPRFRGLGLACRLVRESMPLVNVPIIEASAVMGSVNPFFEKAGMAAYTAPLKTCCVRLKEALNIIGIDESLFIDPLAVHHKIEMLTIKKQDFIEREFRIFLKSFGNKRYVCHSLERTRFVLSRLTERPVYYIWFNKSIKS
jgi:hypothetical protein